MKDYTRREFIKTGAALGAGAMAFTIVPSHVLGKALGHVAPSDKLKLTGRYGWDNRPVAWLEVCKDGKKLWVSSMFVELNDAMWAVLYGV